MRKATITDSEARFPSVPIIIRVPFFLLFSFNKKDPNVKKGERVLRRNLAGNNSARCRDQLFLVLVLALLVQLHANALCLTKPLTPSSFQETSPHDKN